MYNKNQVQFFLSQTGASPYEKSRMFRSLEKTSLGRCVLRTMRPLDYTSLEWRVLRTMRPSEDALLGRCAPRTKRPSDDAPLGQSAHRTMHPSDKVPIGRCTPRTPRPRDASSERLFWPKNGPRYRSCHLKSQKSLRPLEKSRFCAQGPFRTLEMAPFSYFQGLIS